MASSYALPASQHAQGSLGNAPSSPSKQDRHNHIHTSHAHTESHGTGHHTARNSTTSLDRKEVLHGTGVALQHSVYSQWTHPPAHLPSSRTSDTLQELTTGILAVLPFLVVSQLVPRRGYQSDLGSTTEVVGIAQLKEQVLNPSIGHWSPKITMCVVEAMISASAVLLLLAILGRIFPAHQLGPQEADRAWSDKPKTSPEEGHMVAQLRSTVTQCASLILPFYATFQLGGWRVALAVLLACTNGLSINNLSYKGTLGNMIQSQLLVVFLASICFLDSLILAYNVSFISTISGYAALLIWLALLSPTSSQVREPVQLASPSKKSMAPTSSTTEDLDPFLLSIRGHSTTRLLAGSVLSILTILLSTLTGSSPSLSVLDILIRTTGIGLTILAVYFARPSMLRSRHKLGLGCGSVLSLTSILVTSYTSRLPMLVDFGIACFVVGAVLYDSLITQSINGRTGDSSASTTKSQASDSDHHFSPFTRALIQRCEPDSLFYAILIEKDSRRIAYFTCLNFAFMLVQGLYGYLSGSLGLLSDTVHMFFDCLGLVVGLGAAVASKWPSSPGRPFGWGQLNTLAGFGNGIFLMLVSVEFAWEAVEGILEGTELRRVKELLVVSTLGLLINLVGLFAFGHAHAGHDHSHGHSHDHGHSHGHSHADHHSHEHSHADSHADQHLHHDHSASHAHTHEPHDHAADHGTSQTAHTSAHSHAHNENMHGIFLHVAADAGGSLAVIISTALTLMKPWYLWDPLATIIIAALIFAAAVPLVRSSGRKLLLIIPDETEHGIKGFLQEVTEVRGVLGYAAPRFWLNDQPANHDHQHDHSCSHKGGDHSHAHDMDPQPTMVGSVHVIAAPFADLEDVRERVQHLGSAKGIRATVHVEYETDAHCWCGGSQRL